MSRRPRVLLITNEGKSGDAAGQVDGYRTLEATGELGEVRAVSARRAFVEDPDGAVARVLEAIRQVRPDVAVLWTPGNFPGSRDRFESIQVALGSAQLVYWEGDAWHRGKPVTEAMRWWMGAGDIVFSTAGPPQATDYLVAGAQVVHHIPATYCHLKFRACELEAPPVVISRRVTMIGSNLMRIPGLTGLPGSARRAELALRLNRALDEFDLRGSGWNRIGLRAQPIPFGLQADHIRGGALSVGWDHFPYLPDYSSDRLPIALIAGRVHVTGRHPRMAWAPPEEQGLFQRDTPAAIARTVEELIGDRARLTVLGAEAHRWARHRLSHREAARYIMSTVVDSVAPPLADPWSNLPGPWVRE